MVSNTEDHRREEHKWNKIAKETFGVYAYSKDRSVTWLATGIKFKIKYGVHIQNVDDFSVIQLLDSRAQERKIKAFTQLILASFETDPLQFSSLSYQWHERRNFWKWRLKCRKLSVCSDIVNRNMCLYSREGFFRSLDAYPIFEE